MMTDINSNGEIILSFDIVIPHNHPLIFNNQEPFKDLEKATQCNMTLQVHNVRNLVLTFQTENAVVNI